MTLSLSEVARQLEGLLGELACDEEARRGRLERARAALEAFHREHPLRSGMSKEELRSVLGLSARVFEGALAQWIAKALPGGPAYEPSRLVGAELSTGASLEERGAQVALAGHRPRLSASQEAQAQAFLQALRESPYHPPTDRLPDPELLAYLEDQGEIVRVSPEVVFAVGAYDGMVDGIVAHLRAQGTITLAQVRDSFRTSRKYAQALLEHLDQRRITRRVGDERVLRSGLSR